MRILACLVFAAALVGAAWAGGDADLARPGGAYASFQTPSSSACERACAEDGLCMAWSHSLTVCELKAVAVPQVFQPGAASGLSPRVPAAFRSQGQSLPPPAPLPPAAISPPPQHEDVAESALLGGPSVHEPLRPRMGGGGSR